MADPVSKLQDRVWFLEGELAMFLHEVRLIANSEEMQRVMMAAKRAGHEYKGDSLVPAMERARKALK